VKRPRNQYREAVSTAFSNRGFSHMPRNVYSEINLHIVWRTKDNAPMITDRIRDPLYRYIKHRAAETPGVFMHDIGGTSDHVHIAVTIPPTLLISDWIGQIKGAAAHYINHVVCKSDVLHWQSGYGVVAFGKRDLPWVVQYVRDQEVHHSRDSAHDRLERIEAEAVDREGR
jgi:putative transposase